MSSVLRTENIISRLVMATVSEAQYLTALFLLSSQAQDEATSTYESHISMT